MLSNQRCFPAEAPQHRKMSSYPILVLGHNDYKSDPRHCHFLSAVMVCNRLKTSVGKEKLALWNFRSRGHVSCSCGRASSCLNMSQGLRCWNNACRRHWRASIRRSHRLVSVCSSFSCETKALAGTVVMEHVWSQVEPATSIICACIITFRPRFEDWKIKRVRVSLPKVRNTSSSTRPRHQQRRGPEGLGDSLRYHTTWPVTRDRDCHVNEHHSFKGRQTHDSMFL